MKTFKIDGEKNAEDKRRFKYGVIGVEHAKRDLNTWHTFGLAGRLHKPVLPFVQEDSELATAMSANCDHALNLALLMNFHKPHVDMFDLATTICEMSYKGDIRMRFKMENPQKVRNIVVGSFDGLKGLYGPGSERL